MYKMFLIICFALLCISANGQLLIDEICKYPKFDAALAISGFDNHKNPDDKRYFFKDKYVYPYNRNQMTIEWNNIQEISVVFDGVKSIPDANNSVEFAFEIGSNVFMKFQSSQTIYSLDKNNNFKPNDKFDMSLFPYEFISWKIETSTADSLAFGYYYFVDQNAKRLKDPVPNVTVANIKIPNTNEYITITYLNSTAKNPIEALQPLWPLTFVYKETRIPIEFDYYYQTKYRETVFFKEDSACVSMKWIQDKWTESQYCRSFIDTRSIIGCKGAPVNATDPPDGESDPLEPDIDKEPDV